jgi:hypothetical protein|tara:strand:- start:1133 stop:1393 length:261 start_codon:yes stop_codon:yes gene_type:complete
MKLNKYIYAKLEEKQIRFLEGIAVTEEDLDDWIADWYNDTFPNFRDDTKPRGPPMWLCGPRWYDRRKKMIKEAEKIKAAEEKSNDE